MCKSILYKRWDNRVFQIDFEQTGFECTIIKVYPQKDCSYADAKNAFSYNDIEFLLKTDPYGKALDFIQLKKKDAPDKYWFIRKDFLYHIELECLPSGVPADAIMVTNINDYMNVIQFYRYVALVVRIKALLGLIIETSNDELKKAAESSLKSIDSEPRLKKLAYTITTSFNREVLFSAVQIIKDILHDTLANKIEDKQISYSEQQVYKAIIHSIALYEKGENFLHYRGVGHIVYPELPGSLRGNHKYFEDQYYKLAKTTHPDELADLSYLDRIAKIQHYGWPSRLMDVTSNPLVALYMACNTIYSKDDPNQQDFGEIVIYFRDELFEKSYDSKSVLISAALVKLAYQERKAMFEFINMHKLYFKHSWKTIGIEEHSLRKALNLCLRIAVHRSVDTILTTEEIQQIVEYINNPNITFANCKHPVDYIFRCIQGQSGHEKIKRHRSGEDQRLRYSCGPLKDPDEESRYNYVYSEEIDYEAYRKLFSYFVSAYDRLLVTIRRENIAFENKIDIFTMLKSYHVRLGMTNDRILAQAGSFIIAGLDDVYINESLMSSRTKEFHARIILTNKKAIFEELKLLNINDSTMLPDLQHTGEYTRSLFS